MSDPEKQVFTFWIDFAKSCHFRPDRMAEYCRVSPMQFADWFLVVAQRPLDYWLLEAQAWESIRMLAGGRSCDEAAAALAFDTGQNFSNRFQSYFGIPPSKFPKDHERWAQRQRQYLTKIWAPDSVPDELLRPIWWSAFQVLTGRLTVGKTEHGFVPTRRLLLECLHMLVCAGNQEAANLICEIVRKPLMQRLCRKYEVSDGELVEEALHEALREYCSRSAAFDPARGSLEGFLYLVARRDLMNLRQSIQRRQTHEVRLPEDSSELAESTRDQVRHSDEPTLHHLANAFSETLDPKLKKIWQLILDEERGTQAFAQILELHDLPKLKRKSHVNHVKHRLKKNFRYFVKRAAIYII